METTNREYSISLTFMFEADSSNAGAIFQTMRRNGRGGLAPAPWIQFTLVYGSTRSQSHTFSGFDALDSGPVHWRWFFFEKADNSRKQIPVAPWQGDAYVESGNSLSLRSTIHFTLLWQVTTTYQYHSLVHRPHYALDTFVHPVWSCRCGLLRTAGLSCPPVWTLIVMFVVCLCLPFHFKLLGLSIIFDPRCPRNTSRVEILSRFKIKIFLFCFLRHLCCDYSEWERFMNHNSIQNNTLFCWIWVTCSIYY